MYESRIIENYQIMFKLHALNTCQNPNPGDAKHEINLFSPDIPRPNLDTIYSIKAVRCKCFKGSHPVILSLSGIRFVCIINKCYWNIIEKLVCLSLSKCLYKCSCMHFSPLLKLLLLDLFRCKDPFNLIIHV